MNQEFELKCQRTKMPISNFLFSPTLEIPQ